MGGRQAVQHYGKAVIAKGNEIFLMFRPLSAVSGHGCPEKSALSPDGELRTAACV